ATGGEGLSTARAHDVPGRAGSRRAVGIAGVAGHGADLDTRRERAGAKYDAAGARLAARAAVFRPGSRPYDRGVAPFRIRVPISQSLGALSLVRAGPAAGPLRRVARPLWARREQLSVRARALAGTAGGQLPRL